MKKLFFLKNFNVHFVHNYNAISFKSFKQLQLLNDILIIRKFSLWLLLYPVMNKQVGMKLLGITPINLLNHLINLKTFCILAIQLLLAPINSIPYLVKTFQNFGIREEKIQNVLWCINTISLSTSLEYIDIHCAYSIGHNNSWVYFRWRN